MAKKSSSLATVAPAPLTAAEHKAFAAELTTLYHDAIEGHLRVLAFGAKFMEVEDRVTIVTRSSGGRGSKGTGMKAWLEEHCPEIARSTAYKFRDVADAVAKHHGIKEPARIFTAPVKALSAPEQKKRAKVIDYMAERSLRQVQLELGLTSAPRKRETGGASGPTTTEPATPPTPAESHAAFVAAAREKAEAAFDALHSLKDRWKLLGDAALKVTYSDLTRLQKELKLWLDTPEPARIACDVDRLIAETVPAAATESAAGGAA